jgi:hypothetical protein
VHPGDDYSYDIYTQAVQALRNSGRAHPFGDLVPARFLAAGESQSAMRMVTYIDAVHSIAHAYDGFFVHSRAGGATPLVTSAGTGAAGIVGASTARIRDDLGVPVLQFLTETDVLGIAGLGRSGVSSSRVRGRAFETRRAPGERELTQRSLGSRQLGSGARPLLAHSTTPTLTLPLGPPRAAGLAPTRSASSRNATTRVLLGKPRRDRRPMLPPCATRSPWNRAPGTPASFLRSAVRSAR